MNTAVESLPFTAPRKRGLTVLARRHPEPARYSNSTNERAGQVYWQTALWLVDVGLATFDAASSDLRLTKEGRKLAREIGLLSTSGGA